MHSVKQSCHAGLGFDRCLARVVPIVDDELTVAKPYLKEHEEVQAHGWVYYAFNVTDEDFQVVINVAEEEGSQCKLLCHYRPQGIGLLTTWLASSFSSAALL